jgi:membrane protein implicated in regulation of membrane protease activity
MDWIDQYTWVVWLVLILVFITIEVLSLQFTFLMMALGSAVGLLSGLLGVPWWGQFLIGAAASVLLLLLVRPPLLRVLRKGEDPAKSNVDALMGARGQVVQTVSGHGGQVKLSNGELWTAIVPLDSPVSSLEPGTPVRVLAIEGATAVVVPNERKSQ